MEKLLTVQEVATDYLSVHPNTIYERVRNGEIPFIKIKGLGIRFRKEDIDNWLNQGSSKDHLLFESLSRIDLTLDRYDKLFLKGGRMSQKRKTWNYPFGSVYLRLTKTGKERWHIYYRIDGERFREVVKNALSRAEALKVLQVKTADAFRGKYGFKRQEKEKKFNELADLYLENTKKQKSWRVNRYRIESHLNSFFGKLPLKKITPLLIEKYRNQRLEAGIKESTTNREMALLKVMFSKAIDWDLTDENPVRKVKLFPEKDNCKERVLNEEEESRLLDASTDHLRSFLIIALNTGMRPGKEILNLKWNQITFTTRSIRVEKTKSGRIRHIPINTPLLQELTKLKNKNGESPYVLTNPKTEKPFTTMKTAFKAACRRAGLSNLRPYDMRHTVASQLIRKGVDIETVRSLLGHYSVTITQRYTHSNEEMKRKAVENLLQNKADSQTKNEDSIQILSNFLKNGSANALFSVN